MIRIVLRRARPRSLSDRPELDPGDRPSRPEIPNRFGGVLVAAAQCRNRNSRILQLLELACLPQVGDDSP